MSIVTLQGHIIVSDADVDSVKAALVTHIELTKQEVGCIVFNVTQDADNPNRFNVYEEFTDAEAFALHQQRAGSSQWADVTVNVERHYEVTGI